MVDLADSQAPASICLPQDYLEPFVSGVFKQQGEGTDSGLLLHSAIFK